MARSNLAFLAFNRGLVSPLGLARGDIKRIALSAEEMVNWMPRVLGSMAMRPGLGTLGRTYTDAAAHYLPFVFGTSDVALIECTAQIARIWIQDALLTRPAVATAITNGTFAGNITGWTDGSDAGGTAAFSAPNLLRLTGTGTARGIGYQQVAPAVADLGIEHAIRIVISNGPVVLRVGTALGGDTYVTETTLDTGTHSISFTPTGNFFVQFSNAHARTADISNCTIEAAGVVTLPTPWTANDLANLRGNWEITQSGDVLYIACDGFQQRVFERRGTRPNARSWSLALYRSEDGPFRIANLGATTITPSGLTGNITLTSSVPLFKSTHAPSANSCGALFKIVSSGQNVTAALAAENTFTTAIRVTNVGEQRRFTITITGVWNATVTLQRSLDSQVTWQDVSSYTTNQATTFADGLDNQIIHYRIGIKTGNYVSGTATCTLSYSLGSLTGIARVTGFTSSMVVSAEVLTSTGMGATSASSNWSEGSWSDFRGWPTVGCLYEGRLFWAGKNEIFGSESDNFTSFSEELDGDSAPIDRTIGSGPVDTINFLLPLQRLMLGAQGAEWSCRSTSFDEPLTPTNFNVKPASTQGSAAVEAVKIDSHGVFVQRGGTRVYLLTLDNNSLDYSSQHLSEVIPEIGQPRIVRMAVQRQPDTRVHFVRSDGTVAVLIFDKVENVSCWVEVETTGSIEDVVVLPGAVGSEEDQVYYVVNRTIGVATVRTLEKWAKESECRGSALNKQADGFVSYSGVTVTTIAGLTHLEGQTVVVWGDSKYLGTAVVAGGQITLPGGVAAANIVAGLTYRARWKSGKLLQLADQASLGLSLHKRIEGLGLIMAYVHAQGLKYGPSFDALQSLPGIEDGKAVGADEIRTAYDKQIFEFPGEWSTDSRLCLEANAPKPCTVLAAICQAEVHA